MNTKHKDKYNTYKLPKHKLVFLSIYCTLFDLNIIYLFFHTTDYDIKQDYCGLAFCCRT